MHACVRAIRRLAGHENATPAPRRPRSSLFFSSLPSSPLFDINIPWWLGTRSNFLWPPREGEKEKERMKREKKNRRPHPSTVGR